MHDVSQFTKTFKELVNIRYKRHIKHVGSLWSSRFTSTLIEDGRYLVPITDEETERYFYTVEDVERRLQRRMVQLGEGKVLGSKAFVVSIVGALVEKFNGRPVPKKMGLEMYATHGFMLAAEEDAKSAA